MARRNQYQKALGNASRKANKIIKVYKDEIKQLKKVIAMLEKQLDDQRF